MIVCEYCGLTNDEINGRDSTGRPILEDPNECPATGGHHNMVDDGFGPGDLKDVEENQ